MGAAWVSVRDAVTAGTLRPSDKGLPEVAARFDALLRFISLQLGRKLGTEVTPVLTRKETADPVSRTQNLSGTLAQAGVLSGAIRIPGAVGVITIEADLRASRVTCHVDVDAPREGRPTTRVNWLVRQLKDAPEQLRLESYALHARGASAAALLGAVRQDPSALVLDAAKELRSFRIAATTPMGAKRGRGRGAFIDSVLGAVDSFYDQAVQPLKPWSASAAPLPKIRQPLEPDRQDVPGALVSTAISSQDDAQAPPSRHDSDDGDDSKDTTGPEPFTGAEAADESATDADRTTASTG